MRYNPFLFIRFYRHSFLERFSDTINFFCGDTHIKKYPQGNHDLSDDCSSDEEEGGDKEVFLLKSHLGVFDWVLVAPALVLRLAEAHTCFSIVLAIPIMIWKIISFIIAVWVAILLSPIILLVHCLLMSKTMEIEELVSDFGDGQYKKIEIAHLDSELGKRCIKRKESFILPVYTEEGQIYHAGIIFNVHDMHIALYSNGFTEGKVYVLQLTEKNHKKLENIMETGYFTVYNKDRIDAHMHWKFQTFGKSVPSTPLKLSPYISSRTITRTETSVSDSSNSSINGIR